MHHLTSCAHTFFCTDGDIVGIVIGVMLPIAIFVGIVGIVATVIVKFKPRIFRGIFGPRRKDPSEYM
jgi:hypothetical protein